MPFSWPERLSSPLGYPSPTLWCLSGLTDQAAEHRCGALRSRQLEFGCAAGGARSAEAARVQARAVEDCSGGSITNVAHSGQAGKVWGAGQQLFAAQCKASIRCNEADVGVREIFY